MPETFPLVKRRFKTAIQRILSEHESLEIDEAALPAYAHRNPLIDYIFWKRVEIACGYARTQGAKRVLDFGCGTGLTSYALAQAGANVVAIDLNLAPLRLVQTQVTFPPTIRFIEGDLLKIDMEGGFDLIVALDVLEHISDLSLYIERFAGLLNPGGSVIVSGPSENWLYRIGRKVAGQRFTGDYHVSNIRTIRTAFAQEMRTETIATLVWPLTLFEIFTAGLVESAAVEPASP